MEKSNLNKGAGFIATVVGILLWFVGGVIGGITGIKKK
jgi:hypothetical protein